MKTRIISSLAILLPAAVALLALSDGARAQSMMDRTNRGVVELLTGGPDTTSSVIAEDLMSVVDDGTTRRVLPIIGKGTLQNLIDLKLLRGIDVAIVQSDVLEFGKTQKTAPGIEANLTYITKLYGEEFHLLAGENIKTVSDLAGKKVNFGPQGDGTSITGPRIFELLSVKIQVTEFDQRLALAKLSSGEIAAIGYVGGKPVPFFANLPPQSGLHFVPIPLTAPLVAAYVPAKLSGEDYPNLMKPQDSVDTASVVAVMLVANLQIDSERYRGVAAFVDAFFTQLAKLQEAPHHPKWREVNLAAELPGWKRFPAADAWLKRNPPAPVAMSEQQLKDIFMRFLEERSRSTGQTLSTQQKADLFDQFRRWQATQSR
ncbi:MAG TPA: TAXI family TRAP transporter solute-binding subunit [Stellaceae bacterium]|nr:TAXI family TRAP transporter solute-binding subunit [Stellaceae bacterium]